MTVDNYVFYLSSLQFTTDLLYHRPPILLNPLEIPEETKGQLIFLVGLQINILTEQLHMHAPFNC